MSKPDASKLYAAIGELRKKGETPPVPPAHTDFFALGEEFKERCAKLDRYAIELMNLEKELVKMQSQIRECYERVELERKLTLEKHDRLVLGLLGLLDDFRQTSAGKRKVPCRTFIKYLRTGLEEAVRREGIRAMRVEKGELFDPRMHTSSRNVLDKGLPDDTIVEVITPGYLEGSRVLRKAGVAVSHREGV